MRRQPPQAARRPGHPAAAATLPSQRQLRVAEGMRHVIAEALLRGELHDPGLDGRSITVSEVRVSRDLRAATVFASELGRPLSREAAAALHRAARFLAGRITRAMSLKYAPRLEFVADELFDRAAHMEALIREEQEHQQHVRASSGQEEDGDAGA